MQEKPDNALLTLLSAHRLEDDEEAISAKAINDALTFVRTVLDRVPTHKLEDRSYVTQLLDEILVETNRWALTTRQTGDKRQLH